jgi:hypothetical protein
VASLDFEQSLRRNEDHETLACDSNGSLDFGGRLSWPFQRRRKKDKEKASIWMNAKAEFSANILAALTQGDFAKIRRNAQDLDMASHLELLFQADSPEYKQQTTLFIAANKELIRQANAKNIYGATLAFNQLTISCVQCHKMVRETKK